MAYPCNGQAGVDHAAPSQYLEFPPINGWKNEMKDDGWWLIKTVLQNQNFTITTKTLCKYNHRSKVGPKQTDSEKHKLANI